MAKLLARQRLKIYMPGLRCLQAAVFQRANLSTFNTGGSKQIYTDAEDTDTEEIPHVVLPDPTLGPLAAKDPRFPLTGSVGTASGLYPPHPSHNAPPRTQTMPDVLTWPTPAERHTIVLSQFLNAAAEAEEEAENAEIEAVNNALQNHPSALECISQECPETLRKSFLDLFPGVPAKTLAKMSVVTLCQRTKNNMTSWNGEVEKERDELLGIFITSAEEICKLLQSAGYWADFIDPSSGQAFLGDSNPNTSLFETDERFMQLGFEIEDLGCCKCIRHSMWGTHVFIGTIFTNAPPDCQLMKDIMLSKDLTTK